MLKRPSVPVDKSFRVESFFENAQRILDVAASPHANGPEDFAILMSRDGGMRIVMNQPFRLDSVAVDSGADVTYRVVRTQAGVRVEGHGRGEDCVLEKRATPASSGNKAAAATRPQWLLDQPLYRVSSPLLTATASA